MSEPGALAERLLAASRRLCRRCEKLSFSAPVTHVYNPLVYAWEPYQRYFECYAQTNKRVVFLGMNPGPFGMAQTGVAFGEIAAVRDWLGLEATVEKPANEHPKRPIEGFACKRSEVSGQRLWGLFRERFGEPANFFAEHLVLNYCPLLFLEAHEKGIRNLTPDKLAAPETKPMLAACDEHLREVVERLEAEWVVGVGKYAEKRAQLALAGLPVKVSRILHPSPASPAANRGWAERATNEMIATGIWTSNA